MTDVTTTLTGTAAIPAGTLSIPAQTIQVSITIPAQTVQLGVTSAPVSVTLDETTLAAALQPLLTSPSPTVVTTPNGGIIDAQGKIWTLVNVPAANPKAGGQIAVNGVIDQTTAAVVTLAWIAPNIYQVNASGGCWMKSSASAPWVATTFPAITT